MNFGLLFPKRSFFTTVKSSARKSKCVTNSIKGRKLVKDLDKVPGKEEFPIEIFPVNALADYLEGLDKGGK